MRLTQACVVKVKHASEYDTEIQRRRGFERVKHPDGNKTRNGMGTDIMPRGVFYPCRLAIAAIHALDEPLNAIRWHGRAGAARA